MVVPLRLGRVEAGDDVGRGRYYPNGGKLAVRHIVADNDRRLRLADLATDRGINPTTARRGRGRRRIEVIGDSGGQILHLIPRLRFFCGLRRQPSPGSRRRNSKSLRNRLLFRLPTMLHNL